MYFRASTPAVEENAAFLPDLSTIEPPFWKRNCEYWKVSGRTWNPYLSTLPSPLVSWAIALETLSRSSHVLGTSSPFALRMSAR